MSKNSQKSICFIHYGIGWRDGINTVIQTLSSQIQKQSLSLELCFLGGEIKKRILKNACYKTIPELLPKKNKFNKKDIEKRSLLIAKKIAKATKEMDVVVIENPFLGNYHLSAMIGFSIYAYQYKPIGTKVFFRIHDLYIDAPQYLKKLQKFFSPSEIKRITKGQGVDGFFVVNKSLKQKLVKLGIPQNKIFYLPNGINENISDKPLNKKEKELFYKTLKFSYKNKKQPKLLVYPVRVVPRKNIEEAVLLTYFIREITKENYILVVSGKIDKYDVLSMNYYKKLKKLIKLADFPVVFTKGIFSSERKYDSKKQIKSFSIGDLYQASFEVIMTSLMEGFGYPFLECWLYKKIVIGRRTPGVINDFEKNKFDFHWLYHNFSIKKKNHLERIESIIDIFENPELKTKTLESNKTIVIKQIKVLQDKKKQKQIIESNLKAVKENYGISKIAKQFLKLIDLQ